MCGIAGPHAAGSSYPVEYPTGGAERFRLSLPAVHLPTSGHFDHRIHFEPREVRRFVLFHPPLLPLQAFFLSLTFISRLHFSLLLVFFFFVHLAFKLTDPFLQVFHGDFHLLEWTALDAMR